MDNAIVFNPSVILFDVNETLLDMTPLKEKVNKLLNSKHGFKIWFTMLLQYSLVDNCTHQYHDFSDIGNAILHMAAKSLNQKVTDGNIKEVLSTIRQLSAHSDVEEGLTLLKDAGLRLATLSNSPMETSTAQLKHAGLTNYFETILSVDAIKKYKPTLETYRYAADTLKITTSKIVMVAAHGWDITGALYAGMHTAFIGRNGQALYPLTPKPSIAATTLVEVAYEIIKNLNQK